METSSPVEYAILSRSSHHGGGGGHHAAACSHFTFDLLTDDAEERSTEAEMRIGAVEVARGPSSCHWSGSQCGGFAAEKKLQDCSHRVMLTLFARIGVDRRSPDILLGVIRNLILLAWQR
ncbi:hypothetical protein R1flu_005015 [Riccia fluitans]|uniref:Uncharacterized protein n=1 Tax=Riccia fluitans TaxID=41844 RepID=A0ABD1YRY8_9MARC